MSKTEAGGLLHAQIVVEVMEHQGGGEFVRIQDQVTPFGLDSKEEQVVDSQDGSTEGTGGSASRINELEGLLAKITREKELMVTTLDEYKITNKKLQDKFGKEKLTSFAVLGEYKRVQLEI